LATKFLEKFKPYAVALSEHLQFAPRYDIFKPDEGMLGDSNSQLCVSADAESFCAPDPDGGGPVTGEDVVNEDVRQLCLWNVTARRGGTTGALFSEPYWLYVVSFNRRCSVRAHDADHRFGEVCSLSVMREVGIDAQAVQDCVHRNRLPILREQLKNVAWSRSITAGGLPATTSELLPRIGPPTQRLEVQRPAGPTNGAASSVWWIHHAP
ncbi:VSR1, partial [Symbiodinium sp. CCMP2456]